jgi:hypothetical protein
MKVVGEFNFNLTSYYSGSCSIGCIFDCFHLCVCVDFEGEEGFGIVAPSQFIEQDDVQLTCALSKLNESRAIGWALKNDKGELVPLTSSSAGGNGTKTTCSNCISLLGKRRKEG